MRLVKDRAYWLARLKANKALLVFAHRNGDEERAKVLSQEKQRIRKKIFPRCEVCGVAIQYGNKCPMHHPRRVIMKLNRRLRVILTVLLLIFGGGKTFLVCPQEPDTPRVPGSPYDPPPIPSPPAPLAEQVGKLRHVFCPYCREWRHCVAQGCVWSDRTWELSFTCCVCTNILMVPVPRSPELL